MAIDPQAFLNSTRTQESLETKLKPLPAGNYLGRIGPFDDKWIRSGTNDDGRDWLSITVPVKVDDFGGELERELGYPPVTRRSIFVDLVVQADGSIEVEVGPGKNVRLGELLEICNLNEDFGNEPWSDTFRKMSGTPVHINTRIRTSKDGEPFSEISKWAAAD